MAQYPSGLEETWRWYGPLDPVKLEYIRQAGATGIVTALHQTPIGSIWDPLDIRRRKEEIEHHGLRWSVVESVPIHEDIKTQTGDFKKLIENYKLSLRNLAQEGVKTVCYNVMPVLDWTRTDLDYTVKDGSGALNFDWVTLCAFDIHILKREDAETAYSNEVIEWAREWYQQSTASERQKLTETVVAGLPGTDQGFDLDHFKSALANYKDISAETYTEHIKFFLEQIIPVAEENGVMMGVHPDDPPFDILGLPRIMRTGKQVARYLDLYESPNHGLTLCTGSLGADPENNVASIAKVHSARIHFVHLRNVTSYGYQSFYEDNHLEGTIDMPAVIRILMQEADKRDILLPFRPDHGHLLAKACEPSDYPGYPFIGRLRGLAELRGLILGLKSQENNK
jgi:mannonate dehydratase